MNTSQSHRFRKIGLLADLKEKGEGIVFEIDPENFLTGFAILFNGVVYGYRNQCPHAGSTLDWTRGQFFDQSGVSLICATHGALFDPETGSCTRGPCMGQSLRPIPVEVRDGEIYAGF